MEAGTQQVERFKSSHGESARRLRGLPGRHDHAFPKPGQAASTLKPKAGKTRLAQEDGQSAVGPELNMATVFQSGEMLIEFTSEREGAIF